MNDRELLEFVAKAAGIDLSDASWGNGRDGFYWAIDEISLRYISGVVGAGLPPSPAVGGNDTITLPRAVVWKLLAAFRDTHGIITKAGCALDRSEEIAILDAALKEEPKP